MNKHAGTLRNDSRAWVEVPADDNGDAMIAAMTEAGVEYIFFTSGSPTSYPGSFPGARDGGGHIWLQQSFDQNGIVRQYTKWDHRMELQDNVGLMISRALQVARTEPCGPVYLTLPREVSLHKIKGA